MRAAQLVAPRRIAIREVPAPVPKWGEVLVRVRAVGICRSDLHYYERGRIGNQVIRSWPQTLGHETAGEVAARGPGVRGLRPGDRVAVEPAVPCGRCRECRSRRGHLCRRGRFLGMPGQPGALAEFLVVPAANCVRVPPSVSDEEAAALEPLAIGLHAVRLVRRGFRSAAVVGAGPIGLCALAGARLVSGARVTACDYEPARLRIARRMGAARTVRIDPRRPMAAQAGRLGEPEVVFEAGGTPEAVDLSVQAVRPGGIVALIGIMEADRTPVDLHAARRKELAILNVRRSNGELARCVRLVAARRVDLRPMLTHRGHLEDAETLFELVRRRRGGVVKAVVDPVPKDIAASPVIRRC
jgi:L-iditol 2-dehydrogenase